MPFKETTYAFPIYIRGGNAMKESWKKVGLFLSLIVFVMIAAACSKDDSASKEVEVATKGAMEAYSAGDTFKATEPFDLSILYMDQPTYPYKKDWLLWDKIKKLRMLP